MKDENLPVVGEELYLAYGSVTDMKNYQGLPMPLWKDLPEKIQRAWFASVRRAEHIILDMHATRVLNTEGDCCIDFKSAVKDGALQVTAGHGVVMIHKDGGDVPIACCPWCGQRVRSGLYTSAAMSYRP